MRSNLLILAGAVLIIGAVAGLVALVTCPPAGGLVGVGLAGGGLVWVGIVDHRNADVAVPAPAAEGPRAVAA